MTKLNNKSDSTVSKDGLDKVTAGQPFFEDKFLDDGRMSRIDNNGFLLSERRRHKRN